MMIYDIQDMLDDFLKFVAEQEEMDGPYEDEETSSFWSTLLDMVGGYVANRFSTYIESEQAIEDLKAFGAGLLDKEAGSGLHPARERALRKWGRYVAAYFNLIQQNKALKREQQKRIATLSKREIRRIQQLQDMDPHDFEYWVAGYFKRCRYTKVMVTQYSNDFGIDIQMYSPGRVKSVAQVKRYTDTVGRPTVQQTYGAMVLVGAKRCFVVTSGKFTRDAIALANNHPDIYLIDGGQLVKGICPQLKRKGRRRK